MQMLQNNFSLHTNPYQPILIRICKKHLPNKTNLYLQNIEYNYCICVYIYPEEFFNLIIEITVRHEFLCQMFFKPH